MLLRVTSNIKLGDELLISQKTGQRLKRILKDLNIGLYPTNCFSVVRKVRFCTQVGKTKFTGTRYLAQK